jgi:hypothetical protein
LLFQINGKAMKQTGMKKVRELLQLVVSQGQSSRQAGKIVGISKSSAVEYVSGFKLSGLRIEDIANLSDSDLLSAITGPSRKQTNERYSQLGTSRKNSNAPVSPCSSSGRNCLMAIPNLTATPNSVSIINSGQRNKR